MKVAGLLMVLLALAIGIVPLFTNCEAQGRMITTADGRQIPMKCHWTARAEIAMAVPLLAVGGLDLFGKRKEGKIILSLLGGVLGVLVILLPTALIGVCANPEMICNAVMRPFLILTGTLVTGISVVTLFSAIAQKKEPAELVSA